MIVSDDINVANWRNSAKPHGLSGCFRLRNEAEHMRAAILSHMPYLDEAVLVVQPSDDDTLEIAEQLAAEDDRIRVYFYPHIVDWIDTPGFYGKDQDKPGHLVHMSNFALSQCAYDWVCKTEGDVICLSSFSKLRAAIDGDKRIYHGRAIVNMAGPDADWYSHTVPRNGGYDIGVFFNDSYLWQFKRVEKWEMIRGAGSMTCAGWSGIHLKRCRKRMLPDADWQNSTKIYGWNNEMYLRYAPDNLAVSLSAHNREHPYPGRDNPLGEAVLFEDWRRWL